MSKRNKIIVSIVGIFIVLMAIIGITYGYFLTRVTGNTEENSILVTTADLRLVYDNGSGNIEVSNIHPSNTANYTKTFTVTNEGNDDVNYEVHLENIINDFEHDEDLILKIVCESNIEGNTCDGYDSTYPLVNSSLITNSIDPVGEETDAEVHTYTLTLQFKDDGTDQSNDMGKTLQGKINIYDSTNAISIIGTVSNALDGYYVQLDDTSITSQIVGGTYTINSVAPGTHTLAIKYIDSDGNKVQLASKQIVVSKVAVATEVTEVGGVPNIPILEITDSITLPIIISVDAQEPSVKVLSFGTIVVNN